jgi:hypothetical protein
MVNFLLVLCMFCGDAGYPSVITEVEMTPAALISVDSGVASHGISLINDGDTTTYYQSTATTDGWAGVDFGAGVLVSPTAILIAPGQDADSGGIFQESYLLGAIVEGAVSSTGGPWIQLGVFPTITFPDRFAMTSLSIDPNNPVFAGRYVRVRTHSNACIIGELRVIGKYTGPGAWKASRPALSPAAGRWAIGKTVTLTSRTAGATHYYTNDGTTPAVDAFGVPQGTTAKYSSPITLPTNTGADTALNVLTYHGNGKTKTSDIVTGVYRVPAKFVPDTGVTRFGTGQNWPQDEFDDRGIFQETHQGFGFYDPDSSRYWFGGEHWNSSPDQLGVARGSGWYLCSSSDIYNQRFELWIPSPPTSWTDSASGLSFSIHANPTIFRNPSPINANKKYVLWAKLRTVFGTTNGNYAAVLTAPAMAGPWTWLSYFQQGNGNGITDGMIFKDPIGGSVYYVATTTTPSGHAPIYALKLDSTTDYTTLEGSAIQLITSTIREAPVMFYRSGYYFLIHSRFVPFASTNGGDLQYRAATTIAGLFSASDASVWASAPSAGTVQYNTQSVCVLPLNGLSDKQIFMTTFQDCGESPVNIYHARNAWYPLDSTCFPTTSTLAIDAPTLWDLSRLGL